MALVMELLVYSLIQENVIPCLCPMAYLGITSLVTGVRGAPLTHARISIRAPISVFISAVKNVDIKVVGNKQ